MAFPEVGHGRAAVLGRHATAHPRGRRRARAAHARRRRRRSTPATLERSGLAVRADDPVSSARRSSPTRLAAGAPRAQAAAREAVLRGRDLTLADGHRLESDLNLLLSTTRDRAEGIAAFFEKRAAGVHGRMSAARRTRDPASRSHGARRERARATRSACRCLGPARRRRSVRRWLPPPRAAARRRRLGAPRPAHRVGDFAAWRRARCGGDLSALPAEAVDAEAGAWMLPAVAVRRRPPPRQPCGGPSARRAARRRRRRARSSCSAPRGRRRSPGSCSPTLGARRRAGRAPAAAGSVPAPRRAARRGSRGASPLDLDDARRPRRVRGAARVRAAPRRRHHAPRARQRRARRRSRRMIRVCRGSPRSRTTTGPGYGIAAECRGGWAARARPAAARPRVGRRSGRRAARARWSRSTCCTRVATGPRDASSLEGAVGHLFARGGAPWLTRLRVVRTDGRSPRSCSTTRRSTSTTSPTRDALCEVLTGVDRRSRRARRRVHAPTGDHFSAGADLKEFGTAPSVWAMRDARWGRDVWGLLRAVAVPMVASMHGYAVGFGFELALQCDLRLAADDCVVALPEARVGHDPRGRRVADACRASWARARRCATVLTGDGSRADDALARGFVDEVVPRAELARAHRRARRRRSRRARRRRCARRRRAVWAALDLPLAAGLAREADLARDARRRDLTSREPVTARSLGLRCPHRQGSSVPCRRRSTTRRSTTASAAGCSGRCRAASTCSGAPTGRAPQRHDAQLGHPGVVRPEAGRRERRARGVHPRAGRRGRRVQR